MGRRREIGRAAGRPGRSNADVGLPRMSWAAAVGDQSASRAARIAAVVSTG